jgi:hypothetical protein
MAFKLDGVVDAQRKMERKLTKNDTSPPSQYRSKTAPAMINNAFPKTMGMTAIPMIRLGIKCDDSSQCKHLLTCLLLRMPVAMPQTNGIYKAMAGRDEEMSKGRKQMFFT